MNARITGTGSAMPAHSVHNRDFERIIDTSDAWIRSRTGIERRPISLEENTSDLALEAAKRAISAAAISVQEIDLVIVATVTPDTVFPGVAHILQRKLGLRDVPAFDVNAACTGFVYALEIADKMIGSGVYRCALIVGAETLSKITDFEDRNTCVLFADAAGAMVLEARETASIEAIALHARGDTEGFLKLDGYPLKQDFKSPPGERPFLRMQGSEIFKFASTVLPETVKELLRRSGTDLDDIRLIVAHQANRRIIEKAARTLDFPMEKMYLNIERTGNTSAASVPLAVDEAIRAGKLQPGDLFIIVAFGAGLTWGGALIRL